MSREDRWKALGDASDAMTDAWIDVTREFRPENRFRLEAAARTFVTCLAQVVGAEPAFQYETAFRRVLDALDREARFAATRAGESPIDESDAARLRWLQTETNRARTTYDAIVIETSKRLDEAEAADKEPGG
jgi:hypothetical protein